MFENKITFKIDFITFQNLFKGCIFAVFRNATDNIFFSSNILFSIFFYLIIVFHINILINHFFELLVFLIVLLLIILKLLIIQFVVTLFLDLLLAFFILVLSFLWPITWSFLFLFWFEGLNYKSSDFLTFLCRMITRIATNRVKKINFCFWIYEFILHILFLKARLFLLQIVFLKNA